MGQEGNVKLDVDRSVASSEVNMSSGEADCRICQEEEDFKNLETPCACSGSLKYADRDCVQRWCDAKENTVCEIRHQQYETGYRATPWLPQSDYISCEFSGEGGIIPGPQNIQLRDAGQLAMAAAERYKLDDENAAENWSPHCPSVILILATLLFLRLVFFSPDALTSVTLYILLPGYIAVQELMLQIRRRRQARAAAQIEVGLRPFGQPRASHSAVSS